MKETNIAMFYPDALTSVFGACDLESQKAIAHTSSQWHRIMFKIRENKARETLKLIGPYQCSTGKNLPLQQQCFEKMRLLDLRAKRLADWFSATPPNPKYTGEYVELGMFGGGHQDFKSFASYDLDDHVFPDEQLFPHIIIERAIKKYGLSHAATCPLDTQKTRLLDVLILCSKPEILKSYLEHFAASVSVNEDNFEGEHPLEIAGYVIDSVQKFAVMNILADCGAKIEPDRVADLFDEILQEEIAMKPRSWQWHMLVYRIEDNALKAAKHL